MRTAGRLFGLTVVVLAMASVLLVHRRLPWIPLLYLAALVVVPLAGWRVARWRHAPRRLRWAAPAVGLVLLVSLCPVPWLIADLEHPPGSAWKLDGRLAINGTAVDPPGTWYWLSVGRPPIVAELVRGWLFDDAPAASSLRGGRLAQRPVISEPAAAAVGLRRAGWPVELTVVVEVSGPLMARLPQRAVLAALNGAALTSRDEWDTAVGSLGQLNTITTVSGDSYDFQGASMPFRRVDVIEMPRDGLEAAIGGPLARTLPGSWLRDLSLGASHGLMVALVSYVHGSGDDLAGGRSIAGTGTIRGDGSVGRIKGLAAKAAAARDIGADVLLFPAAQAKELASFDAKAMRLTPVATLDEAIDALRTSSR